MIPRDGLRQRFNAIVGNPQEPGAPTQKLKVKLDRDGFAAGAPIVTTASLEKVTFALENRTGDQHVTGLWLSAPEGTTLTVVQDGQTRELLKTGNRDYPLRAELIVSNQPGRIELVRQTR